MKPRLPRAPRSLPRRHTPGGWISQKLCYHFVQLLATPDWTLLLQPRSLFEGEQGAQRDAPGAARGAGGGRTVLQVLGPLLRGHVGLVLLAVEAQQAVLVAEVLHLAAPLHALPQHALGPAAVAASGLRGGGHTSDAGLRPGSGLPTRPSAVAAQCGGSMFDTDKLVTQAVNTQ